METKEAFQARETNPADLPNSDIIQKWSKLLAPKWTDRIGEQGKQMRPEHCINEIHPGCPGVTFPITYASIMPEVGFSPASILQDLPTLLCTKTILPTKCVIVKYNQSFNLGKVRTF